MLILLIVLVLFLNFAYAVPVAEETPMLTVEAVVEADAPVYGIGYALGASEGDAMISGGMCHADGSPLDPGEVVLLSFTSQELPEAVPAEGLRMTLSLTDADDREWPCGEALSIDEGTEAVSIVLRGDFESGFTWEYAPDQPF